MTTPAKNVDVAPIIEGMYYRSTHPKESKSTDEANMAANNVEGKSKKKKKSNIAGFLPFAIFVFSALALALFIIFLRSRA